MKYLYAYRSLRGLKIREESEVTIGACPDKVKVVIKPIARIPVEDLQAEQKLEETNQKISDIDKQIKELDKQVGKLYYEKNKLKEGLDE